MSRCSNYCSVYTKPMGCDTYSDISHTFKKSRFLLWVFIILPGLDTSDTDILMRTKMATWKLRTSDFGTRSKASVHFPQTGSPMAIIRIYSKRNSGGTTWCTTTNLTIKVLYQIWEKYINLRYHLKVGKKKKKKKNSMHAQAKLHRTNLHKSNLNHRFKCH